MKSTFTLPLALSACLSHAAPEPAKEGPAIITEATGKLIAALTEAITKDGPDGAIGVCSEKAPEIAGVVGQTHGVTLRRVTEKPRNPANAATEAELEILAAFAMEMKQEEPPTPKSVTSPEGGTTFFAPIVIPGPLCLQCHGDPEKDIAPETLAAIRKLYPEDEATGYKPGDLRGAWAVKFGPQP